MQKQPPLQFGQPPSPEFEAFWQRYPRKVGTSKKAAQDAYFKARRSATAQTIMAGLLAYPFNPQPQFQPHAATWLNQCRWEIEQDTAPPTVIVTQPAPSRSSWRDKYDGASPCIPSHRTARLNEPFTIDGAVGDD